MEHKGPNFLFVLFSLLGLVPIFAFSSNLAFGYMDGLTLENQAVCLPIIIVHSYLLAIYFAFGRQTFAYRSVVLSAGCCLLHSKLLGFTQHLWTLEIQSLICDGFRETPSCL